MKSPFAILIAVVLLVGIGIGVAAVFFLSPSEDESENVIPIASESELPTPSARNEAARSRSEGNDAGPEAVVVSTSVSVEKVSSEDVSKLEERVESGEAQVVVTVEVVGEGRGQGGFRGGFGGSGGPGGGDFQAIQSAIESNPEIAELMQKAQTGELSQADQARLRELMQEVLAESGIDLPGGGQGGFGVQPIQGTISYVFGSTLTLERSDDSGLTTDVEVSDDTNITLIRELSIADLSEGNTVAGAVRRGEGGKIYVVTLGIVPDGPGGGFGLRGGGTIFGGGDTSISSVQGRIETIADDMIHLETDQGTLRLTVNEDTVMTSTTNGSVSDLIEGMAAVVIGPEEDGTVQARNIIAGPESVIGGPAQHSAEAQDDPGRDGDTP